jgi:hypothetical protein
MSAPFIIPFNFQPVSVAVKTASYTIPAGQYARVVVECHSGGTFTIDAVSAVTTAVFVNVDTNVIGSPSYTVPTGYRSEVSYIPSGTSSSFTVNGNQSEIISQNVYTERFNIGPAGVLNSVFAGGIQGVSIPSNATHRNEVFWVPTGTVLNGTGSWRCTVELYNEIT